MANNHKDGTLNAYRNHTLPKYEVQREKVDQINQQKDVVDHVKSYISRHTLVE